jgi:hypothetical protein
VPLIGNFAALIRRSVYFLRAADREPRGHGVRRRGEHAADSSSPISQPKVTRMSRRKTTEVVSKSQVRKGSVSDLRWRLLIAALQSGAVCVLERPHAAVDEAQEATVSVSERDD